MKGHLVSRIERLELLSPARMPIIRRLAISHSATETEAELDARVAAAEAAIRAQHGRDGLVIVRRIV